MTKKITDDDLIRLYVQPGRGYTDEEMAARFGVGRQAIFRRRKRLERDYVFKETERGRYRIDRGKLVSHIRVKQGEALALYLATRRLSRNTPLAQQYVRDALAHLAPTLYQPMTNKLVEAATQTPYHPNEANRLKIINCLLEAWSEQRVVLITYRSLQWHNQVRKHEVSPYLIEPSPWSDSIYVVGYSATTETIIPFSLERIEKVVLSGVPFTPCNPETADKLLAYAWGIWQSETPPTLVKLRFSGRRAVRRLRESIWHPQQKIEPKQAINGPQENSDAIWSAPIAEWREMIPWIRGWGAAVEVLEPPELYEALRNEARRLAERYGWFVGNLYHQDDNLLSFSDPTRHLWAKTNREGDQLEDSHPLICHLIDIAQVVTVLWERCLPQATRHYLTQTLQVDDETACGWVAFFAGLHDLGKASPTFQGLYEPAKEKLHRQGFPFPPSPKAGHGLVSTHALKLLFQTELGLPRQTANRLAIAIGGHHGHWPTASDIQNLGPNARGTGLWETARHTLFHTLAKSLNLYPFPAITLPDPDDEARLNIFGTLLAGLTTHTDWLGSISRYFCFVSATINLSDYTQQARQQAEDALQELGWLGWQPPVSPCTFSDLFPFEPRPLQQAVITLPQDLPATPALVIIEAPTGEGKTEAAWHLADTWLSQHQQRGIYVAMPSQATSNQMLGRVKTFLQTRIHHGQANLLLLHGDAAWSKDMQLLRQAATLHLNTIDEDEAGGSAATVAAHTWFLPKKRSLLAPFAVGTIDQALLAILQTRHFFVRLFGLSHKTIIFDEVHAYDTYMNTLLQQLLRWLAALGSPVILLSATLPAKTRQQLTKAYTGHTWKQEVTYPAISWATEHHQGVIPLQPAQARTINLAWQSAEIPALVAYLRQALSEGGCIAVICNTVQRAQTIYAHLQAANLLPEDDLHLFHARFPLHQRLIIEQKVLSHFGKNIANRPPRAILVATQVIEQSLDLDFDLLVTDLAPIDLLLQRAGRLHRHQRPPQAQRPTPLKTPCLMVINPTLEDDIPQWGVDRFIYEPYILYRTYLALQGVSSLAIPHQVQDLIEAVYGAETPSDNLTPAWQAALKNSQDKLKERVKNEDKMARQNAIVKPNDEDLFGGSQLALSEDAPDLHESLQALTRLTRPNITLICLHQRPNGVCLDSDSNIIINLKEVPDLDDITRLVQNKLTLSHYHVVKAFASQEAPSAWQKNALLSHYRPVIFTEGCYRINETLTLELNSKTGLIIHQEEK